MAIAFLVLSLIGLVNALSAARPPVRAPFGPAAFGTSLVFGEWTAQVLVLHGAGLVVFAALGALDDAAGVAGLALWFATTLTLGYVLWRSHRVAPIVDAALAAGLGPDYRAQAPPELAAGFDRPDPWIARVTGLPLRPRAVERIADVPYVAGGRRRQRLDIYRGRPGAAVGDSGTRPVLVQIHGGAWVMGKKSNQALPLMHRLAAHGWVCVSVGYRLAPRATWPDLVVDVKRALAWVKANIGAYGGDPARVVVTGGSAGGHLAALVALTAGDPAWQPDFESADTAVIAGVPFYGVYEWADRSALAHRDAIQPLVARRVVKQPYSAAPDVYRQASPMRRIQEQRPPMLVLHGSRDGLVPVEEGRQFAAALAATGTAPVVYIELPGAQHAFDVLTSPRTRAVIAGVERFCGWAAGRALDGSGHERVGDDRDQHDTEDHAVVAEVGPSALEHGGVGVVGAAEAPQVAEHEVAAPD